MSGLPESISPTDEIEVTWERGEDGVRVVAVLGEASITVESSYDATETLPWLVASLPNVLEASYLAMEGEETPQEGP